SGATRGMCIGYISPEAMAGGPIALIRDGDRIRIDARARRIDLLIDDAEFARRRAAWQPRARPRPLAGLLEKYAAQVGSAPLGAAPHRAIRGGEGGGRGGGGKGAPPPPAPPVEFAVYLPRPDFDKFAQVFVRTSMAEGGRQVRVFVSSPGDTRFERSRLDRV